MLEGEEVGRRVRLSDQALRIGRRAPCEWIVGDGAVSSLHCEISARPGEDEARVTDHGSTNGTYVDGARIAGTASLPMGALLLVGRQLFKHEFLAHLAPHHGDAVTPMILAGVRRDSLRHLETSQALVRHVCADPEQGEANRAVLRQWILKWTPHAERAARALGGLFTLKGIDAVPFEPSWRRVVAQQKAIVADLGL